MERKIFIFVASSVEKNRQFAHLYCLDVCLPQCICDRLSNEDHTGHYLDGLFHINNHCSTTLYEPTPLGYIKLVRNQVSTGTKVIFGRCKTGIIMGPEGASWRVRRDGQEIIPVGDKLSAVATNYQVFSTQGVSAPVGKELAPSGYSHTLIFWPRLRASKIFNPFRVAGPTGRLNCNISEN